MKKNQLFSVSLLMASALVLGACQTTKYEQTSESLSELNVSFVDPVWTGKRIPNGQHCKKFGGNGATPALKVGNIPEGTNAIIVEYNDKSYAPLASNGGHGKIGHWVSGSEATLKPVMGGTDQMPDGVFLEAKNRARGSWISAGYLPPCSGGQSNLYTAIVKAVYKAPDGQPGSKLLGTGEITLGRY